MKDLQDAAASGTMGSVLIVDDHPLYSDALAAALRMAFPECQSAKAQSLGAALDLLASGCRPDLVIFDLKLPDVCGISGFQRLREALPDVPVLVVSSLTSAQVVQALMAEGAAGFLPKDAPAPLLREALESIVAGRCYVHPGYLGAAVSEPEEVPFEKAHPKLAELTPQQKRIMKLICAGKPNKQIAYELDLAEATVKAHITALLRRLGVQNRTQAAVLVENSQPATNIGTADADVQAFLSS
ncbi:LuxR C-terminal-related transcriptional regulator [Alloyangia pacifica]|uniref:Two component transcriptional regulator, LuxR family n=1 Tax=Alloyangia pacifica TaxID=311180 RepID=A0A1I6VG71_9RHOB|nr:response regulator transcription factor [Alloyangia pacifica]SDH95529.1 two component transcriptional regulator, LuxR family [Alloyangia pacifica]SFT12474.1 two component transcriptional regulator, LuxR family [Alloyangia pacifica]